MSEVGRGREEGQFGEVLARNIQALVEMRQAEVRGRSFGGRIADAISAFAGSMTFVYLQFALIVAWVVFNLGVFGLRPFDPFPFGLLTMLGSLEAILLSVFVLISQNRISAAADRRAELDLQVNLLAEHEITRAVSLMDAIAERVGARGQPDPQVEEAKADIDPAAVLEAIERSRQDGC
jgi:uncharacterized membrane protein